MSTAASSIEVEVPPKYQVPSYFYLLKDFDTIYASGLFCHIAKVGRKRDQQLRLIWAVEQMLGKLREVREENLQSRSPFFHAKRYVPLFPEVRRWNCEVDSSLPHTSPDPQNERFLPSLTSELSKKNFPFAVAWNAKPSCAKKPERD
jgi:hypothetical protein